MARDGGCECGCAFLPLIHPPWLMRRSREKISLFLTPHVWFLAAGRNVCAEFSLLPSHTLYANGSAVIGARKASLTPYRLHESCVRFPGELQVGLKPQLEDRCSMDFPFNWNPPMGAELQSRENNSVPFCVFFVVTTTLSSWSGHARKCNETAKSYCVNGGVCYYIEGINQLSCK